MDQFPVNKTVPKAKRTFTAQTGSPSPMVKIVTRLTTLLFAPRRHAALTSTSGTWQDDCAEVDKMKPTSRTVDPWVDEVAEKVRAQLVEQPLPLTPQRIDVYTETDMLGEDAWRLLLVLPAPGGPTWNRDDVFATRREAIRVFEELAIQDGHALPGSTIASVTTDEPADDDVALDDEPEEGEDPGREPRPN